MGKRKHGKSNFLRGLVSEGEGYIEAIRPACAFTDNSCVLFKAIIIGVFPHVQSPRIINVKHGT